MNQEELKKEICEIIANQLGKEVKEITPDKSFVEDLNADSLDLTDLVMSLEAHFDFEIPTNEAEGFKTVQHVFDFVESKTQEGVLQS